jgi:cytosine/adenosine deaminase-related metal-dependent hydrolase
VSDPAGVSPGGPAVVLSGARIVSAGRVRSGPLRLAGGLVDAGEPRRGDHVVRLDGHLVFPGLLNAHDHLPLNAFPKLPPLGTFPNASGWIAALQPVLSSEPFRAVRSIPEEVRARHGALKNLLSGATTAAHHDPLLDVMGRSDFPVRVVSPFGWCHSLDLAGRYGPPLEESFRSTPPGARWFVHLAEGTDAAARSERERLDRAGCLGPRTVAIHGVGFSEEDVARVLEAGAHVVWCPASNLSVLGATPAPGRLLATGRLALGTDSRLSGSRDLLEELRAAREASGLPASSLLRLVTGDAAGVLGLSAAGRLEPGAPADLVVVPDGGGDPAASLIEATRSGLLAVVLGGAPRVAAPELLSWLEAAGAEPRRARLDGVPKVVDARLFAPEAAALEPGLELL